MSNDNNDLGHVAYEARRAECMEAGSKTWDQLDEETQQSYNASGQAVARYVQRDMQAQGFAAFVSVGGMDLEQRVTDLETEQRERLDTALEHNKKLLSYLETRKEELGYWKKKALACEREQEERG